MGAALSDRLMRKARIEVTGPPAGRRRGRGARRRAVSVREARQGSTPGLRRSRGGRNEAAHEVAQLLQCRGPLALALPAKSACADQKH